MEANVMVQANIAPTNLTTGRPPTNRPTPQPTPSVDTEPVARPATSATPSGTATISFDVVFTPNAEILSAHPTVTQMATEELITLDIPMPFSDVEITESVISRYVDNVNEALAPSFFRLNFGVHEPTNRVMVQVVDAHTDEVLREIPPESRLDILARIQEFAGLLFDEQS